MSKVALEANNIHKYFGETKALINAHLKIFAGKVMALIGENGAGKSTIIKCISGIHHLNKGKIKVFGKEVKFKNINDSMRAGIAVVHQELQLCENLTIAENIFLGRNITKYGLIRNKYMIEESKKTLSILGIDIEPTQVVSNLTIAEKQMVEIAKALSKGAKILILDEPTDALSNKEIESLFLVIKKLKKEGIAILYVTHRMQEIKAICEYYTIFKDGSYVQDGKTKEVSINTIIEKMIGRKLKEQFPKLNPIQKKEIMEIKNISNKYLFNISLKINKGEILGISGLVGSGRTEFAKTIIGSYKKNSGSIKYKDKKINRTSINHSIQNGIYYVTEDRKKDGLILDGRIDSNIVLSSLNKVSNNFNLISYKKIHFSSNNMKKSLNIKFNKLSDKVSSLSGGNQQKILLAKAIFTNPDMLILDEPTRGVDVGSRKDIYDLINNFAKSGKSVVVISSDLPEIIGISQRVVVFRNGKKVGEIEKNNINEKNIMNLAIRGEGD